MDIERKLNEANQLFDNANSLNLEINSFHLFHPYTINISLMKKWVLTFNYVTLFKGNLSNWVGSSLKLTYEDEMLNMKEIRNIPKKTFNLYDSNNDFFIRSLNFYLSDYQCVDAVRGINTLQHHKNTYDYLSRNNKILSQWEAVEIKAWNTTKNPFILRVQPFLSNNINDQNNHYYIICYNTRFLYMNLFSWYSRKLELKYQNNSFILFDTDNGYYIECEDIEFQENLDE